MVKSIAFKIVISVVVILLEIETVFTTSCTSASDCVFGDPAKPLCCRGRYCCSYSEFIPSPPPPPPRFHRTVTTKDPWLGLGGRIAIAVFGILLVVALPLSIIFCRCKKRHSYPSNNREHEMVVVP